MFNDNLLEKFVEIKKIVDNESNFIEGNLIYHESTDNLVIDRNKEKIKNLRNYAKSKNKICEIGFNAGHSLLLMLDVNPNAEYTLFDINMHNYTDPCLQFIKSCYPNTTINMLYGSSSETLPKYIKTHGNKIFDLIHIDGGHSAEIVHADFTNTLELASSDTIIIFDDYNIKKIKKYILKKIRKNIIQEIKDTYYLKTQYHIIYKKI